MTNNGVMTMCRQQDCSKSSMGFGRLHIVGHHEWFWGPLLCVHEYWRVSNYMHIVGLC